MEADISIWRKPGHFYFALTEQNQFATLKKRRRHGFLPRTVCGRATNSLLFLPSFVVVASSDPCCPAFLAVGRIAATALLLLAPFPKRQ